MSRLRGNLMARPRRDHTDGTTHGHDHAAMLRNWMWRDFANITLGVWLISSPATLGYRSMAMTSSDILSGALMVVFGALTLSARFDLARWGICAVGVWLLFAPLLFWTPDAAAYANDTLVGALAIAFSVLIPMMPSRAHHEVMTGPGPDTPPGWSYNPSDWMQRGPIIAMAFVGFFLSRYLAAYQLGHIRTPGIRSSATARGECSIQTSRRRGRYPTPVSARPPTCSRPCPVSWAVAVAGARCRGWS